MNKAKVIRRGPVKRDTWTVKALNADGAIGDLTPGMEVFILTYGQFSLIEAVQDLVRKTGPAEVVLSTWTAGHSDLSKCADLLEGEEIRSLRLIVDNSFLNRQPGYCKRMIELFGLDCIRTWKGHAKFAAIRNEKWTLAVRTSMNLNTNPRLENLEISDDPALCGFLFDVADDVFREHDPGDFMGWFPELSSVKHKDPPKVAMGAAVAAPAPRVDGR